MSSPFFSPNFGLSFFQSNGFDEYCEESSTYEQQSDRKSRLFDGNIKTENKTKKAANNSSTLAQKQVSLFKDGKELGDQIVKEGNKYL